MDETKIKQNKNEYRYRNHFWRSCKSITILRWLYEKNNLKISCKKVDDKAKSCHYNKTFKMIINSI